MQLHRRRRIASCLIHATLILCIASCGFKLRTAATFPEEWEPVQLITPERYDDITQLLGNMLDRHDIAKGGATGSGSRIQMLAEELHIQDTLIDATGSRLLTVSWTFRFDLFDQASGQWKRKIPKAQINESKSFSISGKVDKGNPEFHELLMTVRELLAADLLRIISTQK